MDTDMQSATQIQLASGPALWRLRDFQEPDRFIYNLSSPEIQELEAATQKVLSQGLDPARLTEKQFLLKDLCTTLASIRRKIEEGAGFSVIRGIPVEKYSARESGILLCGIGAHLGRVMPQSSRGDVLVAVSNSEPDQTPADTVRGYRSGSALPFHSDSCDVVGLLCVQKSRSGGLSAIASTYAVHNLLLDKRPDLLQLLYEPYCIDRHGEERGDGQPYYSTPVFMQHNQRLFTRFNPGYVYSAQRYPDIPRLSEEKAGAMELLNRLCMSDQFRLDIELQPGDLQLLNNNVIVHSRSAYEDYPEPEKKRMMLRLWLFTSQIENIPVPMRDRYRDMESWQAKAHLANQFA